MIDWQSCPHNPACCLSCRIERISAERDDLAAKLREAEEENREHTVQAKAEELWRSDIMAAIHNAGLAIADGWQSRFKLIPQAEPKRGTLVANLEIAKMPLVRFVQFLAMIEGHAELTGETLNDMDVLCHFMGSGASDIITVGNLRDARKALAEIAGKDDAK